MPKRQVAVVQLGARRTYIYARQLEREGLLAYLVTDAAWASGATPIWAKAAVRMLPSLASPFARRTVTEVSPSRVRSSLWPNVASLVKRVLHEETAYEWVDEALSLPNKVRGLGTASIVVNYHGNGGSFLSYAKSRGAKIVTDFIITPKYLEIEDAERLAFPQWEPARTPPAVIAAYKARMARLVALSDIYLCPAPSVASDLSTLPGFDATKVRIVPYGASGVLVRDTKPTPGRVLFAGAAGLRKGLPYLADAATRLKETRPEVAIVVAGEVSTTIRNRHETRNLTFLGKLSAAEMSQEFCRADLFCLPSLAEGSATSIFEALAHGLPVVTTLSSGSVVRDGEDGIIVSERDPGGLASAIDKIVGDRELRSKMSQLAYAKSIAYNDARCGTEFIAVIRELMVASAAGRGDSHGL
jgi:glycosyltransferase involved in cell wall biosynthesis